MMAMAMIMMMMIMIKIEKDKKIFMEFKSTTINNHNYVAILTTTGATSNGIMTTLRYQGFSGWC